MTAPAIADPLTTGQVSAALSRLSTLGLPKLADWLMQPGRGDRCERPAVEAMLRDVLGLCGADLGYGLPEGQRRRARDRTRFELLALWATYDRYAEADADDEPRELR